MPLALRVLCPLLLSIGCLPVWAQDLPAVQVSGVGFELAELAEDALAFSNRSYVWRGVPAALSSWRFTRLAGGIHPRLRASVDHAGFVHIALAVQQGTPGLKGWELVPGLTFVYTAADAPRVRVFRRRVAPGEPLEIPQGGWTGTMVLAPDLTGREERLVPDHSLVPGVPIAHLPAQLGNYIGCPAIVVLAPGQYVASHSIFGPGEQRGVTRVFESRDSGQNWLRIAEIRSIHFANLFVHRDALYLLGVWGHDVAILRSDDGGRRWTDPIDKTSGRLLTGRRFHSAPVPVVVHRGRIWRAMEDRNAKGKWPEYFRAFIMSAPVDADLLRAENWTATPPLASRREWLGGEFKGWLEGNAVVAPDGRLTNILRIDDWEGGRAAVIAHDPATGDALFDPETDIVEFPGGAKKFTIRHDPVSGRYWSLTNWIDEQAREGRPAGLVRNALTLISSPDLRVWKRERVVLSHPDPVKHAFQYVDWQIDGADIVLVSRTSFDDGLGGAANHHDANYFTFHRVHAFRENDLTSR